MRSALKRVNPVGALSWSESTEAEFAKDIWDARNLPGVHYADHHSSPLLNFTQIPERFRPVMKQFLRFLLSMQSYATGNHYLLQLRYFLFFAREMWLILTLILVANCHAERASKIFPDYFQHDF